MYVLEQRKCSPRQLITHSTRMVHGSAHHNDNASDPQFPRNRCSTKCTQKVHRGSPSYAAGLQTGRLTPSQPKVFVSAQ